MAHLLTPCLNVRTALGVEKNKTMSLARRAEARWLTLGIHAWYSAGAECRDCIASPYLLDGMKTHQGNDHQGPRPQ